MEIAATEAARRGVGYVTKAAQRGPVIVTKHDAPVAVVLSATEYQALLHASRREQFAPDVASLADVISSRRAELGLTLESSRSRKSAPTGLPRPLRSSGIYS